MIFLLTEFDDVHQTHKKNHRHLKNFFSNWKNWLIALIENFSEWMISVFFDTGIFLIISIWFIRTTRSSFFYVLNTLCFFSIYRWTHTRVKHKKKHRANNNNKLIRKFIHLSYHIWIWFVDPICNTQCREYKKKWCLGTWTRCFFAFNIS